MSHSEPSRDQTQQLPKHLKRAGSPWLNFLCAIFLLGVGIYHMWSFLPLNHETWWILGIPISEFLVACGFVYLGTAVLRVRAKNRPK